MSNVDPGEARESGTQHTQTVIWVCQELLRNLGLEVVKGGLCMGIRTDSRVDLTKLHEDVDDDKGNGTDQ
jgi:hypothetical protein